MAIHMRKSILLDKLSRKDLARLLEGTMSFAAAYKKAPGDFYVEIEVEDEDIIEASLLKK